MSGLLLAFLVAFFPMTINAAMGFQAVDEDIHRMARTFMGTRWQIFWKIRMPNALPYIFAGMKISITLAIIGVIVSEFVASQEGIGYLIKLAGRLARHPPDDGGDHCAEHQRSRPLRHDRRRRRTRDLLADAKRHRRRRGRLMAREPAVGCSRSREMKMIQTEEN